MPLPRRTFLTGSLAAAATAALASRGHAASTANSSTSAVTPGRAYHELICYRLKPETRLKASPDAALLDSYLENALLPALDRLGVKDNGIFTELEVDKPTATAKPKADSPVWVLITHASLDAYVRTKAALAADPALQSAGAAYLNTPKTAPAYERIDTWLLLAFTSLPKLHVPAFSRARASTRVFEMRDYESHNETKALAKMAMFDEGETALMQDLGMNPVFFGQALAGPDLPHLRYITSGPDLATHLDAWKRFGPDPRWTKMKNDPRWADTVSKNTARFLTPKPYSQI